MSDEPVSTSSTGVARRWGIENWLLVGFFGGLTLAGVALSSGVLGAGVVGAPSETASGVNVPPFVYLYATLGALGYVFTKLLVAYESLAGAGGTAELVSETMRLPAAWVLGAGFYLVMVQGGASPADQPHLFAAVAFLVGLYVNVAFKSLGSLADRMIGSVSRE